MFPDSSIAKIFSCGNTKCGFIVKFGIAPYFVELLNSQLKDLNVLSHYLMNPLTVLKKNKKNQVDLHIRF